MLLWNSSKGFVPMAGKMAKSLPVVLDATMYTKTALNKKKKR